MWGRQGVAAGWGGVGVVASGDIAAGRGGHDPLPPLQASGAFLQPGSPGPATLWCWSPSGSPPFSLHLANTLIFSKFASGITLLGHF